jgi:lipopolysaccharide export system protein LptA
MMMKHPGLASAMAVLVVLGLLRADAVQAQGLTTDFSAYQGNADKPIDIEADLLEVDDRQKQATFRGNVLARQGDFSLRSRELIVSYSGRAAAAASQTARAETAPAATADATRGDAPADITRIEAKGGVIVGTRDKQTATSEWADFDVKAQVITIGGNVVLSQGDNVLRGDRLVIDLKTGRSRFEVAAQDGTGQQRIRGLFQPRARTNPADPNAAPSTAPASPPAQ